MDKKTKNISDSNLIILKYEEFKLVKEAQKHYTSLIYAIIGVEATALYIILAILDKIHNNLWLYGASVVVFIISTAFIAHLALVEKYGAIYAYYCEEEINKMIPNYKDFLKWESISNKLFPTLFFKKKESKSLKQSKFFFLVIAFFSVVPLIIWYGYCILKLVDTLKLDTILTFIVSFIVFSFPGLLILLFFAGMKEIDRFVREATKKLK
ncbi:MAG: hypothetical protein IBV53_01070 [Candidatus Atribacteria bacterium]